MANTFKYNVSTETEALKKGNFWIGANDVPKPTDTTGFWHGITPPLSGYTIYLNKASGGPAIYVTQDDNELISLTNRIAGATFTSATQTFNYYATQSDKMVLNRDYGAIVTNGLVLNIDGGFLPSYPRSGTTWTNISGLSGGTGTLTNGPTYSTDGGGSIVFDGVDDYFTTSNYNDIVFGNGDFSANIWMKFPISSVGEGGAWGPIISKGCTTSAPAGTWWVAQNSTNTNSVALNISSTAGGTFVCSLNSGSLNNGWNNVFVMRQGSTSSMYINGVFRQSDNTSESNLQSTRPLTLCATFTTNITTQRTNASLSSVMLYNRALMPSEIFQNYQAQLPTILGENIITNGLVLYLDAGYRTSYPTSGTSWGNVSGVSGFTGTLTNGPTYNSGNGGSIVFDGTDDRVFGNQLPLNSPYSFTNGNFTLEHWIKPTAYQAGSYFGLTNMILSKGPASTFNYATQVTNSTTLSFISRDNAEGLKYLNFTVPSLTNSITHIVFAVSFSQVSLFINGILSEVKNLTGNPITPYNNDSINIGGEGNTNTFFTGNMYIHRIYNRMLSSLEIQQNFNAQKSRFGL
jgi:hypothetical protein